MFALEQKGHHALTEQSVLLWAPKGPGVFLLSIRLANGVRHGFLTAESEDLAASLLTFVRKDPARMQPEILEHLLKYQCYFTCVTVPEAEYRKEIGKMLACTIDPPRSLTVVNCN